MAQGVLPFKYETEKNTTGMTALAGLPVYLAKFHDNEQEKQRWPLKAFIPAPNDHLQGFARINKELAAFSGFQNTESTATLDSVGHKMA